MNWNYGEDLHKAIKPNPITLFYIIGMKYDQVGMKVQQGYYLCYFLLKLLFHGLHNAI